MSDLWWHAACGQAALFSLAIVLLATARRWRRRLGAGPSYATWLLVPALLLTPLVPRPSQEPVPLMLRAVPVDAPAALSGLSALTPPPAEASGRWLALWLAGTLAVLLIQGGRQWRLSRLGAVLPAGSSPALVGLWRPRVLLPQDFAVRFTPAEQALILAHEQVHRDRHDNLWNLIACVLVALHWWNPLAWWGARQFRDDQELACDAAVLACQPGAVATYTRALLGAHGLRALAAPLASRWSTRHPLVERIAMLSHPHRSTRRQQLAGFVATALAVTTAYAAQSAPADEDLRLDLRLDLAIADTAGGPARHQSSPRLITADGQPVIVGLNPASPGEGAWEIVMFPKRLANGRIEIVTTFRDGQPLATHPGSHTQQARLGEPSELRVRALDGKTELVMSRRVELIDRHALPGAAPR